MTKFYKKTLSKSFLIALLTCAAMFASKPCHAIFGIFSLKGIPVLEPLSTATEGGKVLSVTATEIIAALDKAKQTVANSNTAALFKYTGKFDKIIPASPIPGTKKLAEPLTTDEQDIKSEFHALFMEYPSEDVIVQANYRKKAQEFYEATIEDVSSGTNELNKYLSTDIAYQLADLKNTLDKGGSGAQAADDMNAAVFNNYIAAQQTMDSVVQVIQQVTVLKAQLKVARTIMESVEPLVYENKIRCKDSEDPGKISSNEVYGFGKSGGSINIAFAQVDTDDLSKDYDYSKTDYDQDKSMYEKPEYVPHQEKGLVTFTRAEDPKLQHPFYEDRKKIDELDKMEDIYENIKLSINSHNLVKKLYSDYENFESYNRMVSLWEAAKKALAITDKCSITFLNNLYSDPAKAWCGADDCTNIDDLGVRSGISGWAYEAYEVAKAAMSEDVGKEKFAIPSPIAGAKAGDLEVIEQEKEELQNRINEFGGDEFEEDSRRVELLAWQVGAVGIKSIAEGGWGTQYDSFRVWNDARSFYTQFAYPKYDNFYVFTRAETAEYIIAEGMTGWNIANKNNAIKTAKEDAEAKEDQARKEASDAIANGEEYDLPAKLAEIAQNLALMINDIEAEFLINKGFIPQFKPITSVDQRGEIVNETGCMAAIAAGEAAKSHLKYRTNPLSQLYTQGKAVYYTADTTLYNSVQSALNKLCTRGEALYLGKTSSVQTHASLVNSLADHSIPVIDNYGEKVHTVYSYKEFITAADTTVDTAYFVGKTPQSRDLKAPKEPLRMTYAPLREVFHFDDIDMKYAGIPTKKSFLDHGGEIPPIWELLLSEENPFVEMDFDLKGILNGKYINEKAATEPTLMRGGIMPCQTVKASRSQIEKMSVPYFGLPTSKSADLWKDTGLYEKYDRSYPSHAKVNPCIGITDDFGYNERAGAKIIFTSDGDKAPDSYGRSELGIFLDADTNGQIFWRPSFKETYAKLEALKAEYDNGSRTLGSDRKRSDAQKLRENYLKDIPFNQNQIGAFVLMKEVENNYRKAVEETEKDMAQLKDDLSQELAGIGLTYALDDIDMKNAEDRDKLMKIVDEVKNAKIKEAEEGINKVKLYDTAADGSQGSINQPVKDRIDRFKDILAALKQDKDEMVNMSEDSKPGPELAEEIKTEEANLKSRNKYRDTEKEAEDQQKEDLVAPHCVNYEEGAYARGCPGS